MSDNATPNIVPAVTRRYPRQLAVALTEDLKRAVEIEARERSAALGVHVSQATIARQWMEAGRAITEAAQAATLD